MTAEKGLSKGFGGGIVSGAPGKIRTYGLLLRRLTVRSLVSNTCMGFVDATSQGTPLRRPDVKIERPAAYSRGLSLYRGPRSGSQPQQSGTRRTRFAEAGQCVPFNKENGYKIVDVLKEVANGHDASPARVPSRGCLDPAVSTVTVAARKPEQLEDNLRAVDLRLSAEDVRRLDEVSDPGVAYPKSMVLQLDTAEDPRPRVLHPERYGRTDVGSAAAGGPAEC
jgi:hypothetical protein